MPPTAVNVGAILLLILPGFLGYRFAVWQSADPSQRSPLWQLSQMLEYSVYVHLIGAALIAAAHFFLEWAFGVTTGVQELLQTGPNDFLKKHVGEAVLWFTLYPVYVILGSTILGAYDLPGKVSNGIVLCAKHSTRWLSTSCRLLRWIPIPGDTYPQNSVWYHAFTAMTEGYAKRPFVFVTMKNGDIYHGELVTYPLVPDTELKKDFLIQNALYYKEGHDESMLELSLLDGVGAVLLNSANVESIQIHYAVPSEEG